MKELVNVKFRESLGDNTEIEEEIYSLDTIIYEGDLILDGYSEVKGATLSSNKIYSFGSSKDVSNGTTPAEHTVVFKVIGNLTVKYNYCPYCPYAPDHAKERFLRAGNIPPPGLWTWCKYDIFDTENCSRQFFCVKGEGTGGKERWRTGRITFWRD